MTLRRLAAAVPVALLVAVLAHVAGFGAGHAPGGEHAAGLLRWLGAALALSALAGFFSAGLGSGENHIATTHRRRKALGSAGAVALVAAAAFMAIEVAEGHFSAGGSLRAFFALLPATVLVGCLRRYARSAVARAGRRFAAYGRARRAALTGTFATATPCGARWRRCRIAGRRRGRAPPLPA